MNGRCETDPLDHAVDVCDRCYGEFCEQHLVRPKGRRHPLCGDCALAISGVRGSPKLELIGEKKTAKKRRAALKASTPEQRDEEVFRFFDAPEERKAPPQEVAKVESEPVASSELDPTESQPPPPTGPPIGPEADAERDAEEVREMLSLADELATPQAAEPPENEGGNSRDSGDSWDVVEAEPDAPPIPTAVPPALLETGDELDASDVETAVEFEVAVEVEVEPQAIEEPEPQVEPAPAWAPPVVPDPPAQWTPTPVTDEPAPTGAGPEPLEQWTPPPVTEEPATIDIAPVAEEPQPEQWTPPPAPKKPAPIDIAAAAEEPHPEEAPIAEVPSEPEPDRAPKPETEPAAPPVEPERVEPPVQTVAEQAAEIDPPKPAPTPRPVPSQRAPGELPLPNRSSRAPTPRRRASDRTGPADEENSSAAPPMPAHRRPVAPMIGEVRNVGGRRLSDGERPAAPTVVVADAPPVTTPDAVAQFDASQPEPPALEGPAPIEFEAVAVDQAPDYDYDDYDDSSELEPEPQPEAMAEPGGGREQPTSVLAELIGPAAIADGDRSSTAEDFSDRADVDGDGNWIPPILRGMAEDARETAANLPRRRGAPD